MASQPGACIVTAVLQAGLAVDTTAQRSRDPDSAQYRDSFSVSNNQPKLHRLHLVLTDAPQQNPRYRDHPAFQEEVRLAFCGAMPLTVKKNLSGRFDQLKMDGNSNMSMAEVNTL